MTLKLNTGFFLGIFSLAIPVIAVGQTFGDQRSMKTYTGLGFGLDYGGIGMKTELVPLPRLGIFGGLGFNTQTFGVNGGLSFKILTRGTFTPLIQAMYGYNTLIRIKGAPQYNKTYYGPSFGTGFDWHVDKKGDKLFLGIYCPLRSNQFRHDYDQLKYNNYNANISRPTPVTISIGFNWRV